MVSGLSIPRQLRLYARTEHNLTRARLLLTARAAPANLPAQIRLKRADLLDDVLNNRLVDFQRHRASNASWI